MTERGHDWLTIVLGLACLSLLGGGGAALCMSTAVPPGTYFVSPRIVIWVRWGAQLVGKLPGLALGGALLGAYLRRVDPWHVLAGVAAYIVCVDVLDVFVGTRAASSMIAVMGSRWPWYYSPSASRRAWERSQQASGSGKSPDIRRSRNA
jgi:hypothetical protein